MFAANHPGVRDARDLEPFLYFSCGIHRIAIIRLVVATKQKRLKDFFAPRREAAGAVRRSALSLQTKWKDTSFFVNCRKQTT